MGSRSLHAAIATILVVGVLALAPAAGARTEHASAPLTLLVNYSYTGQITVTLPNGTPVGTQAGQGQPTVISAGYYNIELNQPGCVDTPAFIMQGPGVNVLDDMENGEIVTDAVGVFLQPNSTYTWRDGSINPPIYNTFATNGSVVGTAPVPAPSQPYKASKNQQTNKDLVGSGTKAARVLGSLEATLDAAGTVHLTGVASLGAGRYSLTVNDRSKARGLKLTRGSHTVALTGTAFVGKRTTSVMLTAGTWTLAPTPAGKRTTFVVR